MPPTPYLVEGVLVDTIAITMSRSFECKNCTGCMPSFVHSFDPVSLRHAPLGFELDLLGTQQMHFDAKGEGDRSTEGFPGPPGLPPVRPDIPADFITA